MLIVVEVVAPAAASPLVASPAEVLPHIDALPEVEPWSTTLPTLTPLLVVTFTLLTVLLLITFSEPAPVVSIELSTTVSVGATVAVSQAELFASFTLVNVFADAFASPLTALPPSVLSETFALPVFDI